MHNTIRKLLGYYKQSKFLSTGIIPWSCPVPVFGDLATSKVATLGINPSNKEFLDNNGLELAGKQRRFHTLNSLGIKDWDYASNEHIRMIIDTYKMYFNHNPYDIWFRSLDKLISGTNTSYYNNIKKACHLDLVPFATKNKWTELNPYQRNTLLEIAPDILNQLLAESKIEILILNGMSVIETFQAITHTELNKKEMPNWNLPRTKTNCVKGYSFSSKINKIAGMKLNRSLIVLGFNHNIQGSFGVTSKVRLDIAKWITKEANR